MEKILVVEDERNVRENIIELLSNEGFLCLEAEDGLSAIKIVKKELPDLILADLIMPKINGFEFYSMVKSMEVEKNIPFIFLTARTDAESMNYAMGLGADDYLVKPYKAEILIQRIKTRLLKQKQIEENFEKLKTNISLYIPHEFRTPLVAILGYTQLLLSDFNGFDEDEKKEMIRSIYNSGLRFHNRIEKFVNFTEYKLLNKNGEKIDTKEIVNPSSIDFNNLLDNCFDCKERTRDIEFDFESANLNIKEKDLISLFIELIENACKFSPVGSTIIINGKNVGNNYIITFASEGEEFSIFRINEFLKNSDNYNKKNNGLGLAIVQMITKVYNIDLESSFDQGVKIKLKFPA